MMLNNKQTKFIKHISIFVLFIAYIRFDFKFIKKIPDINNLFICCPRFQWHQATPVSCSQSHMYNADNESI